tara:strand:+ start:579 stop:1160 length:582 start_codon:yes stop_codon:yes gene_type:complete
MIKNSITTYLILSTFVSTIFTILFYVLLTRFGFFSPVLFLRGNISIALSFLFLWAILTSISYYFKKKNFIKLIIINFYSTFLPALLVLIFHILFLVSYERSISVYALAYLESHFADKIFTSADFSRIINDGYMKKTNATKKRIFEQINIGYFEKVDDDKFVLTKKAKDFIRQSRFISDTFKIKRTFLWPEKVF